VIIHEGSASGGHYSAYRKSEESTEDGLSSKWFYLSDSQARRVEADEVFDPENRRCVPGYAYMLFYEKKHPRSDSAASSSSTSTTTTTTTTITKATAQSPSSGES
jgi:hypothetical protein